ncbi:uncharacterized protein LOC129185324 isoform X2 [Dunckerocampus dactyliophorus]|uniref:uncharacterized protein LOC129185324 isoform X2 n=1 Tax=Dunckerocampus dactyliophorus TaxID=161453 RepID=UPI00240748AD|nr:uncharacterized protein LOC129185324 isoform X2 [Dunckerocampus dactyliophorus]
MQSLAQEDSGPNPLSTQTTLDNETNSTESASRETGANEQQAAEKEESHLPMEDMNGQTNETPADEPLQPAVAKEPSQNTEAMEVDQGPKSPPQSTPSTNKDQVTDEEKSKKNNRRFPSKMIDPLKMDMTKPVVMPLTSSELSLQCIECHIIFSDTKSKQRHLKASHPAEYEQRILTNAVFTCYVCDRSFTNSTELMAHQKAHVERKPYKCPLCSQAFKKTSELTLHKKIHIGEDGYTCADCGKLFRTLTLLKYHRRVHTGELPYVCKECGDKFSMSKALQKHMLSHLPEGAQARALKKKRDPSANKYHCSICKATFKSPKTLLHHLKAKHNILPASLKKPLLSGSQMKQMTPVITPISISQPSLLQLEPNGPLQKVDGNIDTEPIRRLIESLENVQKVNQVVILGQVPPDAPPLEVQQISEIAKPVDLYLKPPQLDFVGLTQGDAKTVQGDFPMNSCDPMEQTIILEPITPDGQLINPPFSQLGSHIVSGESFALSLAPSEQRMEQEGDLMQQTHLQPTVDATNSNTMDSLVCNTEGNNPKEDLEQMIILELTPALTPTAELEQSQNVPQQEITAPSLAPTTELEHSPYQSIVNDTSVPSAEQNMTSVETNQIDLPREPTQAPEEAGVDPQEEAPSQIQSECQDKVPQECQEKTTQDDESLLYKKQGKDDVENETEVVDVSSKKTAPSQSQTKQGPQISELPVSVMSAQELVKVRKRKPARALFIQSYMQELIGTILDDELQCDGKPAKRKKAKKSHLVVKFSPQKEKQKKGNKKQATAPQRCQSTQDETIMDGETNPSQKKVPSKKKGAIPNKGKKAKNLASSGELNTTPLSKESQMSPKNKREKDKEKTKKEKKKKVKTDEHGTADLVQPLSKQKAILKKKKKTSKIAQKDRPQNKKMATKARKKKEDKSSPKTSKTQADSGAVQITQDSLLLLKGHKQPQLKVHKLDPSKTSGQSPEDPPRESQSKHIKDGKAKHKTVSANRLNTESKKKGKQPKKKQKALSLLSFINATHQPPETQPAKPKTSRKRKAPSNVETEGVITSAHSRWTLECKNCGEIFSEVACLQKHKATVHVLESPGLTYTNGNIFEGVSRLDVCQQERVIGLMNHNTGWDTEPEMTMEDRERSVSFPALIPSPSLPPPHADEGSGRPPISPKCTPPLDIVRNCEPSSVDPFLDCSSQTKDNDALVSTEEQQRESTPKKLLLESEIQATMNEDMKEDVVLGVDLITVGEQNESSNESLRQGHSCRNVSNEISSDKTLNSAGNNLKSVSCATPQADVKEEDEELLVAMKRRNPTGDRRPGKALRRDVRETELEEQHEDCQVVYEKLCCDSQMKEAETSTQASQAGICPGSDPNIVPASAASLTMASSTLEESFEAPEEQDVVELESAPTNVQPDRASQPLKSSPRIILTKIIPSGQAMANRQHRLMSSRSDQRHDADCTAGNEVPLSEGIKVEENTSYTSLCAPLNESNKDIQPQQHRDIRTVLVKEESRAVLNDGRATPDSRHSTSSFTDVEETTSDCRVTPDFNNKQCIFYPVKEEEKELPLGSDQTNCGSLTTEASTDIIQTPEPTYDNRHNEQDYQEMREPEMEVDDFTNGQEVEAEWQNPPELQHLLFQSSDEEDAGSLESSPPPVDCEADVMAYFHKNGSQQPGITMQNVIQAPGETRRPIHYFSKYFGWDTWVDIAHCTNQTCNILNCVTASEVAQFVGIHIAMGTLKFPSPRLYWEDLTKVSLIAEAMPLTRFLQLSRMLKLASPAKDPVKSTEQRTRFDLQKELQGDSSRHHVNSTCQRRALDGSLDPLWKVLPLLCRFQQGCQSLRSQGDYAVDQYLIPLTREHKNRLALHSTTLIGFGGLLLHVNLKVDLSDKEGAVEKMVPNGSTVFLCKQELSTPAMLERLLAARIHGAGRVGGARGQIGDEFVSSDGKLMLRRTHCGFILSTADHSQRNMAALMDNFEKAQTAARLNRDLLNLYSIPVSVLPTCWPLTVLWYLTDLALVNSWLLYRHDHTTSPAPLSLMDFRLQVSKALIHSSSADSQHSVLPNPTSDKTRARTDPPNPSTREESPLPDAATRYDGSGHWPEQLAEGEGGRCRFGDCQRTSRVLCLKCCVFLCISRNHNCFLNFHNQASSGTL